MVRHHLKDAFFAFCPTRIIILLAFICLNAVLFLNLIKCVIVNSEIEAQVKELQNRRKGLVGETEEDRVALGAGGHFDTEIYEGHQDKFAGYVTSIAPTDEQEVSIVNLWSNGIVHTNSGIEFKDFILGFRQSAFLCTSLKCIEKFRIPFIKYGIPASNLGSSEARNPAKFAACNLYSISGYDTNLLGTLINKYYFHALPLPP